MLESNGGSVESYFSIPQNTNNYVDLIVSNTTIKEDKYLYKNQQLAIQYREIEESRDNFFTITCDLWKKFKTKRALMFLIILILKKTIILFSKRMQL